MVIVFHRSNFIYEILKVAISALVLARDSHIKHDSEAGGLIWVEGWYQGRFGKFHVIIFLSHILNWPFPSIDEGPGGYAALFYFRNLSVQISFLQYKSRCLIWFDLHCLTPHYFSYIMQTVTFEWKFLFNTMYTFELIIPFQVI
jgi:hypothetical protein